MIDLGAQGSLSLLTFQKKITDPKSDQIYLLKIAVEIVGVNPPLVGGPISPPPVSQDLIIGSKRFKRHSIDRISTISKHPWFNFFGELWRHRDVKMGQI